jgi:hypothetical protein
MDTTSVAYVLCRIEDDSSLTPVSEHQDIAGAVAAGKHQVEVEDFDFGYGLYSDGVRVASFAEGRIGYREWARRNGRLANIHSLDDPLDHDVDELSWRSLPSTLSNERGKRHTTCPVHPCRGWHSRAPLRES